MVCIAHKVIDSISTLLPVVRWFVDAVACLHYVLNKIKRICTSENVRRTCNLVKPAIRPLRAPTVSKIGVELCVCVRPTQIMHDLLVLNANYLFNNNNHVQFSFLFLSSFAGIRSPLAAIWWVKFDFRFENETSTGRRFCVASTTDTDIDDDFLLIQNSCEKTDTTNRINCIRWKKRSASSMSRFDWGERDNVLLFFTFTTLFHFVNRSTWLSVSGECIEKSTSSI